MRPRQIPKRDTMSAEGNRVAAFMKVRVAPLHTLTDAMVESIARTHKGGRPGAYEKLLAELRATLEHRKAQEGAGG